MSTGKSKAIKTVLVLITSIFLLITVFFTNFALVVFDFSHFEEQFDELDRVEATGMEEQELYRVTEEILNYLQLQRQDIDIQAEIEGEEQDLFTEREIIHMEDVQDLFAGGYKVLAGAALLLIVILYFGSSYLQVKYSSSFSARKISLAYLLRRGALTSLGIMVMVAVVFFMSFDFWYDQLHWWLFDNEYWLLNPEVHNLISIYPVPFFYNTLVRIVARTVIYLVGIYLISLTFPRFSFQGLNKS